MNKFYKKFCVQIGDILPQRSGPAKTNKWNNKDPDKISNSALMAFIMNGRWNMCNQ